MGEKPKPALGVKSLKKRKERWVKAKNIEPFLRGCEFKSRNIGQQMEADEGEQKKRVNISAHPMEANQRF